MFFRPSGGVLYHLRAWRSQSAWQPFREQIKAWLEAWSPPTNELILVGPSAGYTLPTDWLKNFDQITAYDLDPLAPALFRLQHPKIKITFQRQDMFWRRGQLSLDPLKAALRIHPKAAVLFVNVLGQVLVERKAQESDWQEFLAGLRRELGSRSWASYHDRYSSSGTEVIDHLTGGRWSEGLKKNEFRWQLTAQRSHQIEGLQAP